MFKDLKKIINFADREFILEEVQDNIKLGENVIVVGIPKSGKSSILRELSSKFKLPHYLTVFISSKDIKTERSVYSFLAEKIKEIYKGAEGIEYLSEIVDKLNSFGIKTIFFIDDLHEFIKYFNVDIIEDNLWTLPGVNYVVSLPMHLVKKYQPFGFKIINIGLLSESGARDIVASVEKEIKTSLQDELDFILRLAGLQPFFIKLLCYFLAKAKTRKTKLEDKDYSFVKEEFLRYASTYFYFIWDSLTKEEKTQLFNIISHTKELDKNILRYLQQISLLKPDGSIYSESFYQFINDRLKGEIASSLEFVFKSKEDKKTTQEFILPSDKKEEIYITARVLVKAVETKDKYIKGHSDRVTKYALLIAKELGLREVDEEIIKISARLHDIGKIGIDELILIKPSQLTEYEYSYIKQHPIIGINIVSALGFPYEVIPLIKHHHERLNGSGYPNGLCEDDIPYGARILAVADVFDAMTSDRAYRPARPLTEAVSELQDGAGVKYDPTIVATFINVLQREMITQNE